MYKYTKYAIKMHKRLHHGKQFIDLRWFLCYNN